MGRGCCETMMGDSDRDTSFLSLYFLCLLSSAHLLLDDNRG